VTRQNRTTTVMHPMFVTFETDAGDLLTEEQDGKRRARPGAADQPGPCGSPPLTRIARPPPDG